MEEKVLNMLNDLMYLEFREKMAVIKSYLKPETQSPVTYFKIDLDSLVDNVAGAVAISKWVSLNNRKNFKLLVSKITEDILSGGVVTSSIYGRSTCLIELMELEKKIDVENV